MHTGVKSFGCENRMPQLSPSHSWNEIGPSVVSALKSGARSLMRRDMVGSFRFGVRAGASSHDDGVRHDPMRGASAARALSSAAVVAIFPPHLG